jgi:fructose-specific phosphotransferase system IIC component
VVYGPSGATLVIRNARIKSAESFAVYVAEGGSNKVQLMSCVGIAGAANSIYAANADTLVLIPGGWVSNQPVHGHVTLVGGFVAPDADVW